MHKKLLDHSNAGNVNSLTFHLCDYNRKNQEINMFKPTCEVIQASNIDDFGSKLHFAAVNVLFRYSEEIYLGFVDIPVCFRASGAAETTSGRKQTNLVFVVLLCFISPHGGALSKAIILLNKTPHERLHLFII